MMPNAPIAQFSSAPPLNMLYSPSNEPAPPLLLSKNAGSDVASSPGTCTTAVSLQMARTKAVNKIRDFNSGILKQLLNVWAMAPSMIICSRIQAWLPQARLPQAWLPQAWLSQARLSQAWLPQAWLPQAWLPQAWLPQAWLLCAWLLRAS